MKANRLVEFFAREGEDGMYEHCLLDVDKEIKVNTKFITKTKRSGIWEVSGFINDAKMLITVMNLEVVRISAPVFITLDNVTVYVGQDSQILEPKWYYAFSDAWENINPTAEIKELIDTLLVMSEK